MTGYTWILWRWPCPGDWTLTRPLVIGDGLRTVEVMHLVALARVNRLLLIYPLGHLFDYFESRARRQVVYIR